MAYTTIDNPELYFQVKTYTGNGGTQSLTFDGSEDMSPNLVWIKSRSRTDKHTAWDTVRGTGRCLFPSHTLADESQSTGVTAFGSDGFSLGAMNDVNYSSATFVAWCWKEASGIFDIVSYTGTGSTTTVAHSLGATPSMILAKTRDSTTSWACHHKSIGNNTVIALNSNSALQTIAGYWGTPNSSTFGVLVAYDNIISGEDYIAYCFRDVQGFSKFGSYTGNGSANGTFVYLGFRPAFVLFKGTASNREWILADNKRDPHNEVDAVLYANTGDVEGDSDMVDFTSNGFKLRTSAGPGTINTSGESYIYMAFAEAPFVNSNGVPCNAR